MADVQVEAYHRFHTDGEPFPDYLPYHAVEDGVVLLCDRQGQTSSIGMIWEVEPARLEGAPEDNWDIVAAAVNGMLLRLPEDAACQLLLMSDTHVADDLSGFLGLTCTNGLARSVCEGTASATNSAPSSAAATSVVAVTVSGSVTPGM